MAAVGVPVCGGEAHSQNSKDNKDTPDHALLALYQACPSKWRPWSRPRNHWIDIYLTVGLGKPENPNNPGGDGWG